MTNRRSFTLRSLSFLMAFSFLLTDLSYSAPLSEGLGLMGSPKPFELSEDPTRFEAPVDFSTLKEIRKGTNPAFIIHLQDAHSNLSGQKNLANTLDAIMSKYGVSLVLVEGGAGDGTLTPIKKIVPDEACKRISKSLLMEGEIAGEEYLNLTTDHPMKIVGVEDINLYAQSIKSYAALTDKREKILEYLRVIEKSLDKLKVKLYPKEILNYEKSGQAGDKGFEINFKELLELARAKAVDFKEFPNIEKLAALQEKEKGIDFDAANLEQAALVEEISKLGGREDLENYLKKAGQMKNSKASQFAFFQNTFDIAKEKGILLEKYPNLILYGNYLERFSDLDLERILEELSKAQDKVYISWLPEQDARLVHAIDRYVSLLNTAYRIQMSTKDFKLFEANEPDFATISYLAFINRRLVELGYFEDVLPCENILEDGKKALVAFYDSVDKRDVAFIENTERILKEENQKVAVLITGGYHTPHLSALAREKGYSWAVLTPFVTQETNQTKYENLLLAPVKKEVKKVETVQGESRTKSLSVLEKDLIQVKRKEEVRKLFAMMNMEAGTRLAPGPISRLLEGNMQDPGVQPILSAAQKYRREFDEALAGVVAGARQARIGGDEDVKRLEAQRRRAEAAVTEIEKSVGSSYVAEIAQARQNIQNGSFSLTEAVAPLRKALVDRITPIGVSGKGIVGGGERKLEAIADRNERLRGLLKTLDAVTGTGTRQAAVTGSRVVTMDEETVDTLYHYLQYALSHPILSSDDPYHIADWIKTEDDPELDEIKRALTEFDNRQNSKNFSEVELDRILYLQFKRELLRSKMLQSVRTQLALVAAPGTPDSPASLIDKILAAGVDSETVKKILDRQLTKHDRDSGRARQIVEEAMSAFPADTISDMLNLLLAVHFTENLEVRDYSQEVKVLRNLIEIYMPKTKQPKSRSEATNTVIGAYQKLVGKTTGSFKSALEYLGPDPRGIEENPNLDYIVAKAAALRRAVQSRDLARWRSELEEITQHRWDKRFGPINFQSLVRDSIGETLGSADGLGNEDIDWESALAAMPEVNVPGARPLAAPAVETPSSRSSVSPEKGLDDAIKSLGSPENADRHAAKLFTLITQARTRRYGPSFIESLKASIEEWMLEEFGAQVSVPESRDSRVANLGIYGIQMGPRGWNADRPMKEREAIRLEIFGILVGMYETPEDYRQKFSLGLGKATYSELSDDDKQKLTQMVKNLGRTLQHSIDLQKLEATRPDVGRIDPRDPAQIEAWARYSSGLAEHQPIESIPDGTEIILYDHNGMVLAMRTFQGPITPAILKGLFDETPAAYERRYSRAAPADASFHFDSSVYVGRLNLKFAMNKFTGAPTRSEARPAETSRAPRVLAPDRSTTEFLYHKAQALTMNGKDVVEEDLIFGLLQNKAIMLDAPLNWAETELLRLAAVASRKRAVFDKIRPSLLRADALFDHQVRTSFFQVIATYLASKGLDSLSGFDTQSLAGKSTVNIVTALEELIAGARQATGQADPEAVARDRSTLLSLIDKLTALKAEEGDRWKIFIGSGKDSDGQYDFSATFTLVEPKGAQAKSVQVTIRRPMKVDGREWVDTKIFDITDPALVHNLKQSLSSRLMDFLTFKFKEPVDFSKLSPGDLALIKFLESHTLVIGGFEFGPLRTKDKDQTGSRQALAPSNQLSVSIQAAEKKARDHVFANVPDYAKRFAIFRRPETGTYNVIVPYWLMARIFNRMVIKLQFEQNIPILTDAQVNDWIMGPKAFQRKISDAKRELDKSDKYFGFYGHDLLLSEIVKFLDLLEKQSEIQLNWAEKEFFNFLEKKAGLIKKEGNKWAMTGAEAVIISMPWDIAGDRYLKSWGWDPSARELFDKQSQDHENGHALDLAYDSVRQASMDAFYRLSRIKQKALVLMLAAKFTPKQRASYFREFSGIDPGFEGFGYDVINKGTSVTFLLKKLKDDSQRVAHSKANLGANVFFTELSAYAANPEVFIQDMVRIVALESDDPLFKILGIEFDVTPLPEGKTGLKRVHVKKFGVLGEINKQVADSMRGHSFSWGESPVYTSGEFEEPASLSTGARAAKNLGGPETPASVVAGSRAAVKYIETGIKRQFVENFGNEDVIFEAFIESVKAKDGSRYYFSFINPVSRRRLVSRYLVGDDFDIAKNMVYGMDERPVMPLVMARHNKRLPDHLSQLLASAKANKDGGIVHGRYGEVPAQFEELIDQEFSNSNMSPAYRIAFVRGLASLKRLLKDETSFRRVVLALREIVYKDLRGHKHPEVFWENTIRELAPFIRDAQDVLDLGRRAIREPTWKLGVGNLRQTVEDERAGFPTSKSPQEMSTGELWRVAQRVIPILLKIRSIKDQKIDIEFDAVDPQDEIHRPFGYWVETAKLLATTIEADSDRDIITVVLKFSHSKKSRINISRINGRWQLFGNSLPVGVQVVDSDQIYRDLSEAETIPQAIREFYNRLNQDQRRWLHKAVGTAQARLKSLNPESPLGNITLKYFAYSLGWARKGRWSEADIKKYHQDVIANYLRKEGIKKPYQVFFLTDEGNQTDLKDSGDDPDAFVRGIQAYLTDLSLALKKSTGARAATEESNSEAIQLDYETLKGLIAGLVDIQSQRVFVGPSKLRELLESDESENEMKFIGKGVDSEGKKYSLLATVTVVNSAPRQVESVVVATKKAGDTLSRVFKITDRILTIRLYSGINKRMLELELLKLAQAMEFPGVFRTDKLTFTSLVQRVLVDLAKAMGTYTFLIGPYMKSVWGSLLLLDQKKGEDQAGGRMAVQKSFNQLSAARQAVQVDAKALDELQRYLAGLANDSFVSLFKQFIPFLGGSDESRGKAISEIAASMKKNNLGLSPLVISDVISLENNLRILEQSTYLDPLYTARNGQRFEETSLVNGLHLHQYMMHSESVKQRIEKIWSQTKNWPSASLARVLYEIQEDLEIIPDTADLPRGSFIVGRSNGRLIWKKIKRDNSRELQEFPDAVELSTLRENPGLFAVKIEAVSERPMQGISSRKSVEELLKIAYGNLGTIRAGYVVAEKQEELSPEQGLIFIQILKREIEIMKDVTPSEADNRYPGVIALRTYLSNLAKIYNPQTGEHQQQEGAFAARAAEEQQHEAGSRMVEAGGRLAIKWLAPYTYPTNFSLSKWLFIATVLSLAVMSFLPSALDYAGGYEPKYIVWGLAGVTLMPFLALFVLNYKIYLWSSAHGSYLMALISDPDVVRDLIKGFDELNERLGSQEGVVQYTKAVGDDSAAVPERSDYISEVYWPSVLRKLPLQLRLNMGQKRKFRLQLVPNGSQIEIATEKTLANGKTVHEKRKFDIKIILEGGRDWEHLVRPDHTTASGARAAVAGARAATRDLVRAMLTRLEAYEFYEKKLGDGSFGDVPAALKADVRRIFSELRKRLSGYLEDGVNPQKAEAELEKTRQAIGEFLGIDNFLGYIRTSFSERAREESSMKTVRLYTSPLNLLVNDLADLIVEISQEPGMVKEDGLSEAILKVKQFKVFLRTQLDQLVKELKNEDSLSECFEDFENVLYLLSQVESGIKKGKLADAFDDLSIIRQRFRRMGALYRDTSLDPADFEGRASEITDWFLKTKQVGRREMFRRYLGEIYTDITEVSKLLEGKLIKGNEPQSLRELEGIVDSWKSIPLAPRIPELMSNEGLEAWKRNVRDLKEAIRKDPLIDSETKMTLLAHDGVLDHTTLVLEKMMSTFAPEPMAFDGMYGIAQRVRDSFSTVPAVIFTFEIDSPDFTNRVRVSAPVRIKKATQGPDQKILIKTFEGEEIEIDQAKTPIFNIGFPALNADERADRQTPAVVIGARAATIAGSRQALTSVSSVSEEPISLLDVNGVKGLLPSEATNTMDEALRRDYLPLVVSATRLPRGALLPFRVRPAVRFVGVEIVQKNPDGGAVVRSGPKGREIQITGADIREARSRFAAATAAQKPAEVYELKAQTQEVVMEAALRLHSANGVPVLLPNKPTVRVVLVDSFRDLPNNAFYQDLIIRFSQTLAPGSQVIFVSRKEGKAETIASLAAGLGVKNHNQFIAMKEEDLSKIELPTTYILSDTDPTQARRLSAEGKNYFKFKSPEKKNLVGVYELAPIGVLMDYVSLGDWAHAAELYSRMTNKNISPDQLQKALRQGLIIPFVSELIARLASQVYMAERALASAA